MSIANVSAPSVLRGKARNFLSHCRYRVPNNLQKEVIRASTTYRKKMLSRGSLAACFADITVQYKLYDQLTY